MPPSAMTARCAHREGWSRRTWDIRGRAHRLDPTLAPLSAKLPVPVAEESGYAGSLCHLEEGKPSCGRASNAKIESCFMDRPRLGGMQASVDQTTATSTIAWAKACGAS